MAGSTQPYGSDKYLSNHLLSEINVTPFVDVMLVLLIIFMIAAPTMIVGVPVNLPKTSAERIVPPQKPSVVTINQSGALYLQDKPQTESGLINILREAGSGSETALVYVRADKIVPYGRVMEVMSMISAAGVGRVSLLAEGSPTQNNPIRGAKGKDNHEKNLAR